MRRSKFRLQKIEHRLEVLDGYLIAYLNLDEVIRIVRFEDDPKAKLIKRFKLTEVQAEAILNLRLKSLSKLEEIEIKAEHDKLSKERRDLKSLLKSDDLQWERITEEVKATREAYSKKTELGRRRSTFADAPAIEVDLDQAMIEKEPITVILSEKGWIRAMKGHMDDLAKLEFKQGDQLLRAVKAHTTDKLLLLATNGKVFTLPGDQLPGGRGHGEPVRLMVDLEENHAFVEIFVHEPGRKLVIAATSGHGFVVPEDEMVAMTRKGKQVMNLTEPEEARCCVPADGDHGRRHRREPQDADLPAGGSERDGARQGRAPAALQGRRPVGRAGVQQEGGPVLARSRRAHLHAADVGVARLGRRARPGRPAWRRAGSRNPTNSAARSERSILAPCSLSLARPCAAQRSRPWVDATWAVREPDNAVSRVGGGGAVLLALSGHRQRGFGPGGAACAKADFEAVVNEAGRGLARPQPAEHAGVPGQAARAQGQARLGQRSVPQGGGALRA